MGQASARPMHAQDMRARDLPGGWGALVAAAFLIPVAGASWLADPFSLPKATIWWAAAILAAVGVVASTAAASRACAPIVAISVAASVEAEVVIGAFCHNPAQTQNPAPVAARQAALRTNTVPAE